MNVAIIGWGFLVWDKRGLKTRSPWYSDGPVLPVEFARISEGGRVTLVIVPGKKKSPTCWALSAHTDLDTARNELGRREGIRDLRDIHGVTKEVRLIGPPGRVTSVFTTVLKWLRGKNDLDAAIWTGLESNWENKLGKKHSAEAVVDCLSGLTGDTREKAKEYFVKAPRSIDTPVRRMVEEQLGWTPSSDRDGCID